MNNNVLCAISFVTGAAIGSFVSWRLAKNKYKQIADEEIASVKELFSYRKAEEPKKVEEKPNLQEYSKQLQDMKYTIENEEKGESMAMDKPYVISPDDFDELDDYESESLTYYADGVLTDFMDNVIENVDELVGEESLNHFGDYEDDSVFVRNDRLKKDFEILMDIRNFSDVRKSPPHVASE
jgi:hypothetical protein